MLLTAVVAAGCATRSAKPTGGKIGFMPKLVGIPYFNACQRGAEEALRLRPGYAQARGLLDALPK